MLRAVGVGFAGAVALAGMDKLIGFDDGCGHILLFNFGWYALSSLFCFIIVVVVLCEEFDQRTTY